MAKKHFIAYSNMTKKQKFLNFLKVLGFSLAGVVAVVGAVVLYVYLKGDLIPGPVPLTEITFKSSQADADGNRTTVLEYVIDGNKQILVDADGNQVKENGNLVWEQKKDDAGNPVLDSIFVGANEGCTELDAVLTIDYHSDLTSPIIQIVEDENCSAINKDESDPDKLYYSYNVKINSPIYIKPLTKMTDLNGVQVETNVGGWVKITITQGQQFNSCWIFVDDPILDYQISVDTTKFEKDESFDEQNGYYNVYSNSKINIAQAFNPANSLALPSTNVPQTKGTTGFSGSKTVTYRILPDKIASINSNGDITINPNMEGETFTVQAFVISKYNDIGKEPTMNYTDPSQDETVIYNKAFNKIRVFSNTITFKINEIEVKEINVSQPTATPSFDVFEDGYITHSNTITGSTKNSYKVDITLTEDDEKTDYKTTLLTNVKLFVGKAEGIVEEKPVALSENDFVVWDSDIKKYKQLIDASNYVTLTKTATNTYHYVINDYSSDDFYFVFYYELGETEVTEILYDFVKFNIQKNEVKSIEILSKQSGDEISTIKLKYNNDEFDETYSLTDNLNINLTPADTSKNPTYTCVLYFVPQDSAIVSTDSQITAKIADKTCFAVCVVTDELSDYTTLVPTGTGQTKLYVAVVKTTTRYTGQSNIEFLLTGDGFVDIELYSSLNLEISSTVRFNDEVNYDETKSLKVERVETPVDSEDEEYDFAKDCKLYAEVYEEGKVEIVLNYVGDDDAVKNDRVQILMYYGAADIAQTVVTTNGEGGIYSFTINALKPGYAKFQVLYDDNDGNTANDEICKIAVKVLPTQLVGLTLGTSGENVVSNSELNVAFSVESGETNYSWNDLLLNIYYNSPKTETKSFELRTYALPALFDADFLASFDGESDDEKLISFISLYKGKTFTEEIDSEVLRENNIETLEKLISVLTLDDSVLKIYNTSELDETPVDADIKIFDIEASETDFTNYKFKVNSIGRVLIFAQSNDIFSNPILVETKCPEVKVYCDDEEIENIQGTIYAFSELTSIDNHTTTQNQQNLLKDADGKQINFVVTANDTDYNINNLIKFKFQNQTVDDNYYTSTKTGAKITKNGQPILSVGNIKDAETYEDIVIATDFGFVSTDICKYTIISDYKLTNSNPNIVYDTPAIVNLFNGTTDTLSQIVVTNAQYDFENMSPAAPNKLFLPKYFDDSNLSDVFPDEFLASFYYADPDIENPEQDDYYYHIYKVLNVANDGNNAQNYIAIGQTGEIELQYKSSEQSINVFVKTNVGQISTSIKVKPGVVANFGSGYTVVTENLTGDPIQIKDKLTFNNTNDYTINITSVDFAVANPNDDLTFYFESDALKRAETYVQVAPENLVYSTSEYVQTTDTQVVDGKTYYTLNNNVYTAVETPNVSEIGNYYEKLKAYYYIQTTDVSSLTEGKTYYQLNNGVFEVVANPKLENIDSYFEKVYSNKIYYGEETNYQAIPDDELNFDYKAKYYEVASYGKTEDMAIIAGKEYFTLSDNKYQKVKNPSAEDLSSYYEVKEYQKTNDTQAVTGKTYYYKLNYIKLPEGSDITNVFDKLVLTLNVTKDGNNVTAISLGYVELIKTITSEINLTLKISATITNGEATTNFNQLYFNITLQ